MRGLRPASDEPPPAAGLLPPVPHRPLAADAGQRDHRHGRPAPRRERHPAPAGSRARAPGRSAQAAPLADSIGPGRPAGPPPRHTREGWPMVRRNDKGRPTGDALCAPACGCGDLGDSTPPHPTLPGTEPDQRRSREQERCRFRYRRTTGESGRRGDDTGIPRLHGGQIPS
jgi:hypothetical protein